MKKSRTDEIAETVIYAVMSLPSLILHNVWFVIWFVLKMDVNLLTNIVSLEAIDLAILIGFTQRGILKHVFHLHKKLDERTKKTTR